MSTEFISNLEKEHYANNYDYILYKNYFISLAIQNKIQSIIDDEKPILITHSSTPFIENACCNTIDNNTYNYFSDKDPSIESLNATSYKYIHILDKYKRLNKPVYFVHTKNTQRSYPMIADSFSEKTIYISFIYFCKFNTDIQLHADLVTICKQNTSNFNKFDSIETKIKIMKSEGLNYDESSFYNLLNYINYNNSLSIDFSEPKSEYDDFFNSLSGVITDEELLSEINKLLESYGTYEDKAETIDSIIDVLVNRQMSLYTNIIRFLELNGIDSKQLALFEHFFSSIDIPFDIGDVSQIKHIADSDISISEDNTTIKYITFIKNTCGYLIDYISIILNSTNYQSSYNNVQNRWNLSFNHTIMLGDFIKQSYSDLRKFYENEELNNHLLEVLDKLKPLRELIDCTPFDLSQRDNLSLYNYKLIINMYKYYILMAFNLFTSNIKKSVPKTPSDDDLLEDDDDEESTQFDIANDDTTTTLNSSIAELLITYSSLLNNIFKKY